MTVSLMRGWRWATSPLQITPLVVALAILLILPGLAADISYVYDEGARMMGRDSTTIVPGTISRGCRGL
jgi:hypothetical protein